jgi:predicted nucleic acid-binding Zn ribbon protein
MSSSRKGRDEDPLSRDRRAGAVDRDVNVYHRRRRVQARQRAKQDRAGFDPAPPTDDDWVVPDEDTDGLRRIGAPTPVSDSLSAYIDRRGWSERLRGANAWTRWDEIVGADLADRCEPVRLAGGSLVVRAESQVWATQLRYLLPQLRANVDEALGAGTVRDVRIVVGPLEGRTSPDEEP